MVVMSFQTVNHIAVNAAISIVAMIKWELNHYSTFSLSTQRLVDLG